jgi:peptidoglycan/xylan/chitin deacetylase (PgdA/CDA1 family)
MPSRGANSVKTLGAALVSASSLHRWLHSRFRRDELTILMYHGVTRNQLPVSDACFIDETAFRQQMKYLRQHFSVVPLSRAIDLLTRGAVDRPTVVLTFDDGYQNNFDVAFPVLKEFAVPATIFLTTGFVDSSNSLWFCHVIRALTSTQKQSIRWKDMELDLSDPRRRSVASNRLQAAIKEYPPAEVLSQVMRLSDELEIDPLLPFGSDSPFRILNVESIREMIQSGLVEFGAHTKTHAILSLLSPEEQQREIWSSVEAVKCLTGEPCRLFAYPNGRPQDYDTKTIDLLRESGVSAAVCTSSGPNHSRTSLMELKRYGVGSNLGMSMFQLQAHHFIAHLAQMRNRN